MTFTSPFSWADGPREREVSLRSGEACAKALESVGYRVTRVDVGRDVAEVLAKLAPDVAFNALHGRFGEDGAIQGVLEILRIPYTHSGVLASSLAMKKDVAKSVMAAAGVPVPGGRVLHRFEAAKAHALPTPYVLKPVSEGSSFGVFIVKEGRSHPPQELLARRLAAWRLHAGGNFRRRPRAHLRGDGRPPARRHRDHSRCRRTSTVSTRNTRKVGRIHVLAGRILNKIFTKRSNSWQLVAHRALGCRGVSRADFRYDDRPGGTGELVVLEVNTQPGMTETSLVPELAAHAGYSFGELVRWMVEDASCDR